MIRHLASKQTTTIFRVRTFILLLVILLSSGCSFHNGGFSYFNMLDSEKGTIGNKEMAKKFWASVRPVETLSSSHYKLGRYYQQQEKYHKAIEEFAKALRNDKGFCKAYNGIAMSYDALRQCSPAHKTYAKALKCNPALAYLYNNFACSSLLCGDFDKGLTLLQKAAELDSSNGRIKNNLEIAQSLAARSSGAGEKLSSRIAIKKNAEGADRPFIAGADMVTTLETHNTFSQPTPSKIGASHRKEPDLTGAEFPVASHPEPKGKTAVWPNIPEPPSLQTSDPEQITRPYSPQKSEGLPVLRAEKEIQTEPGLLVRYSVTESAIEVSNGNGATGMAGRSAKYLRDLGFTVGRITNAKHFHFSESVIFYREGYLEPAQQLAKVVPGAQDLLKVVDLGRAHIGIRLLLGKDLVSMHFPDDYYYKRLAGIEK